MSQSVKVAKIKAELTFPGLPENPGATIENTVSISLVLM
ncbi:MAG: Uncharacterised protein [Gammaproteobacteria bacterium]|nr:MAG: Uncharacterised protein [Gammaproteobacteria bacterium]